MTISYCKGDATQPVGTDPRVIIHCCNDIGGWGSGFVVAVSRRWPQPEKSYREWHRSGMATLGQVQFVAVEPNLWVANIIGQHGVGRMREGPPIRYDAIEAGLNLVATFAKINGASIHGPRLGAGLAGGSWKRIEGIIERTLKDFSVTIYDL